MTWAFCVEVKGDGYCMGSLLATFVYFILVLIGLVVPLRHLREVINYRRALAVAAAAANADAVPGVGRATVAAPRRPVLGLFRTAVSISLLVGSSSRVAGFIFDNPYLWPGATNDYITSMNDGLRFTEAITVPLAWCGLVGVKAFSVLHFLEMFSHSHRRKFKGRVAGHIVVVIVLCSSATVQIIMLVYTFALWERRKPPQVMPFRVRYWSGFFATRVITELFMCFAFIWTFTQTIRRTKTLSKTSQKVRRWRRKTAVITWYCMCCFALRAVAGAFGVDPHAASVLKQKTWSAFNLAIWFFCIEWLPSFIIVMNMIMSYEQMSIATSRASQMASQRDSRISNISTNLSTYSRRISTLTWPWRPSAVAKSRAVPLLSDVEQAGMRSAGTGTDLGADNYADTFGNDTDCVGAYQGIDRIGVGVGVGVEATIPERHNEDTGDDLDPY